MKAESKVQSKRNIILWIAAFSVACICLSGLHIVFTARNLGEWLFLAWMPGAFALILIDGPHGDFNLAGGIVYVLVNTVYFYYVFRFVAYLWNRFRRV